MKTKLLYIILILQVAVLITLFAWHQSKLSLPIITLRVERIDPRDLLRGDYLILNYEVGKLPEAFKNAPANQSLFAVLRQDGEFFVLDHVQNSLPTNGETFLQGIVKNGRLFFGIEQYFVPEGQGNPTGNLSIQVAIDSDGNPHIKQLYMDGKPWPLRNLKALHQKSN